MGRAVKVGRVAKAHGTHGEAVVERFGETPGLLDPGRRLRAVVGERERDFVVATARPSGDSHWLVRFEGVADRDAAEKLAGTTLSVDESELPPLEEGTWYRFQLVGLRVSTPDGADLGTLEEVWETGANDVYVVRGEKGEILLPAIASVIAAVDLGAGTMTVTPIPGLLPGEEQAQ